MKIILATNENHIIPIRELIIPIIPIRFRIARTNRTKLFFYDYFATKVAKLLRLGKKRINSFVLLSTFRNFVPNLKPHKLKNYYL